VHEKKAFSMICPEMSSVTTDASFIKCKGSECMAWRFDNPPLRRIVPAEGDYKFAPPSYAFDLVTAENNEDGDGDIWVENNESLNERRLGFCGLAGKP